MRKLAVGVGLLSAAAAACGKVENGGGGRDAGVDPDAPQLVAIAPDRGIVGIPVTLTGRRFGDQQGDARVTFGGAEAMVLTWSDTAIEVELPDVVPGEVEAAVSTEDGESGTLGFRVILPEVVYLAAHDDQPTAGIRAFAFSSADGTLEELEGSPFDTGAPHSLAYQCAALSIHVPTRRLFATGSDHLSVFDIDPRTGALRDVEGSPFPVGELTGMTGIAVNRAGDRLFVSSYGQFHGVKSFAVDGEGAPTPLDSLALGDSAWVDHLVLSDSEEFLYVNPGEYSLSEGIYALSVASDGQLAAVPSSPFTSVRLSNGTAMRPGRDQLGRVARRPHRDVVHARVGRRSVPAGDPERRGLVRDPRAAGPRPADPASRQPVRLRRRPAAARHRHDLLASSPGQPNAHSSGMRPPLASTRTPLNSARKVPL